MDALLAWAFDGVGFGLFAEATRGLAVDKTNWANPIDRPPFAAFDALRSPPAPGGPCFVLTTEV